MAILNVTINSTTGNPIDGKYWFVARFYNQSGQLISNPNYPQNQVVSTDSTTLPAQISVQVGDGNYTINNVHLRLHPLTSDPGSKNLTGVSVSCTPSGCVNPTYGASNLEKPVCENGTSNNIGKFTITGLSNYTRYKFFTGSPSTGGYDTASPGSSSTLEINVQFPESVGTTTYTLRFYNGGDDCYTDLPIIAEYADCSDEECCNAEIIATYVDTDPSEPIDCDLKHDADPEYRFVNNQRQIRPHIYSARPNIGPFIVRIYDKNNNIVQTINNVNSINDWININNSLDPGTYSISVTDREQCTTGKRDFIITTSNCDISQEANPQYQLSGGQKQVKAFIYSAIPNIGPFTYKIYTAGNSLVQSIPGINDPNAWVNINTTIDAGSYQLEVMDGRGCVSEKKSFTIS